MCHVGKVLCGGGNRVRVGKGHAKRNESKQARSLCPSQNEERMLSFPFHPQALCVCTRKAWEVERASKNRASISSSTCFSLASPAAEVVCNGVDTTTHGDRAEPQAAGRPLI